MSYIVDKDVILYTCSCGHLKTISRLYFCRHCVQIRCGYCVCHEVDSHFCGKCAENIPSSEARMKKNRCFSCYDCPCCQHQLSIRVSHPGQRGVFSPGVSPGTPSPRKVYYLSCLFCRWNTRDVGIPDQSVAVSGWPERENIWANRLTEIQEKCKTIVLWQKQQKADKEKKKMQRGKYITLTDKTGLTAAMIRKRVGLPDLTQSSGKPLPPAVAKEEVEQLDPEIFTKTLQITDVTSLKQRLLQPEWQPSTVDLLFPVHKQLSVKRSLRCRNCEHNVSKPEYNPNSVKFKIPLFAYYHIPEVRICTIEKLAPGKTSKLILKFTNPTPHTTTVTLLPIVFEEPKFDYSLNTDSIENSEKDDKNSNSANSGYFGSPMSQPLRYPSITVPPRFIKVDINSEITLPSKSFIMPPRDDAAEFDDSGDIQYDDNDPQEICWRKSNKVGVSFNITPNENLEENAEVLMGFTMEHIYVNTITTVENRLPQECKHKVNIIINLGKI